MRKSNRAKSASYFSLFVVMLAALAILATITASMSTANADEKSTADDAIDNGRAAVADMSKNASTADLVDFGGVLIQPDDAKGEARYIITLADPAVASYRGGVEGFAPTSPNFTGESKLDVNSSTAVAYANYLAGVQADFTQSVAERLDRDVKVHYNLYHALNAVIMTLEPEEAAAVARLKGVKSVERDTIHEITTDSGPEWIEADSIWGGTTANYSFVAELSGLNEVPPITTTAEGTAQFAYDFMTGVLHYEVSATDLVNVTGMHVHTGTVGVNGGVVVGLDVAAINAGTMYSVTLDAAQQADFYHSLMNQGLYLNIHTSDNPSGEIRGQLMLNGTLGAGIVVGILDTGINLDHPSFAGVGPIDGYLHTNPLGEGNYIGLCDSSNPDYDPTMVCNSKLIGGWDYADGNQSGAATDFPGDGFEDSDGHGSHTASTSAGNVVTASLYGYTTTLPPLYTAIASGVAPHANVIAYDVCGSPSCNQSAVVAAINQTILDGVDVINESIGIGGDTFTGAKQAAYLGAYDAGIFVARSAGNSGPGPETVGPEPLWVTSVAATTHDRNVAIVRFLENMSGGDTAAPADIEGLGITDSFGPAPIVYAGDYPNANDPGGDPAQCLEPYPAGTFNGEIVVCDRGTIDRVAKGANVAAGGAGGLVLANITASSVVADRHVIPGIHIDVADGDTLKAWLATGNGHTATLGDNFVEVTSNPDVMAGFSSRGPADAGVNSIKPDVGAPGVNILAAVNTTQAGAPAEFGLLSGTSMASPHIAGAAALMKAVYPSWSPMQIRSAMMTTGITDLVKEDGSTPTDPFDLGGGRVDLSRAQMVGLVFDETATNFENANPANDGDPATLNIPSLQNNQCVGVCSWDRTVMSVASMTTTWTVMVEGITATVTPPTFTLGIGESATFNVEVDIAGLPADAYAFGNVMMVPDHTGVITQHMPIAVYPDSGNLPESLNIETQVLTGTRELDGIISVEITDLNLDVTGLVVADQTDATLPQHPDIDLTFPNIFFAHPTETLTLSRTVGADAFSIVAEIAATESPDLDMVLFWDANDNGVAELSDIGNLSENPYACQSATGGSFEFCEIVDPMPGTYFIMVINYATSAPDVDDPLTVAHAIVPMMDDLGNMSVSGPATNPALDPYTLTVDFDLTQGPAVQANDKLYGAFYVGSSATMTGNIGTTKVYLDYLGLPDMSVSPDAVTTSAETGTSVDETITISNAGEGRLDWSVIDGLTGVELVEDGSFELGLPNPHWVVDGSIANPLCTLATCGGVEDDGQWFLWFGGWGTTSWAAVTQTLTIPDGVASLSFNLLIGANSPDDNGFLDVTIDGNSVAMFTQDDAGDFGGAYTPVVIDVSAYADGGSHELAFFGQENGTTTINFFVDSVSIQYFATAVACNSAATIPWLSASPTFGSVVGNASGDVTLTFDADGLTGGVYTDTLCVTGNDPANPVEVVDLEFTVTGVLLPPEINVAPTALESTQAPDTVVTQTLTISNLGSLPLNWAIGEVGTAGFAPEVASSGTVTIWHQAEDGTGGIVSDFVIVSDNGGFSASDFVVEDVVTIDNIFTPGFMSNTSTPINTVEAITWAIYADANGEPAGHPEDGSPRPSLDSALWSYTADFDDLGVGTTADDISLDLLAAGEPPVLLGPGTYWLTVFTTVNDLTVTRWNWSQGLPVGEPTKLIGARFGLGTWTGLPTLGVPWSDTAFTLKGEIVCATNDMSWLTLGATSGSIGADGSVDVDVVFDTAGLSDGTYNGELCINSNDPATPEMTVPITLTVDTPMSNLRVAHLAPFAMGSGTAVTVTLNATPILTDFNFAESTQYITVPSGDHDVAIYVGSSMTPAISDTVTLMPGEDYSAIAVGGAHGWPVELQLHMDDNTAPAAGMAHVRFGHLAPFTSVMTDTLADIRTSGGDVVVDDVPYDTLAGYMPLPASEYDLQVTSADGSVVYMDLAPFTLNEGDILYAVAVGDGTNQDLGVFAWATDAVGMMLPMKAYGVEFMAETDALTGMVGTTVTYTVHVTNTGNMTDTFDISATGTWTTTAPATIELGAGEMDMFYVTVQIPADAENEASDMATVTATSQGDDTESDSVMLTTTAVEPEPTEYTSYLPIVVRP